MSDAPHEESRLTWREVALDAIFAGIATALLAVPLVIGLALQLQTQGGPDPSVAQVAGFAVVLEVLVGLPMALAASPFVAGTHARRGGPAREIAVVVATVSGVLVAITLGVIECVYGMCATRTFVLGLPFAATQSEFGRMMALPFTTDGAPDFALSLGAVISASTGVGLLASRHGALVSKSVAVFVLLMAAPAGYALASSRDMKVNFVIGSCTGASLVVAIEGGALLRRRLARRIPSLARTSPG